MLEASVSSFSSPQLLTAEVKLTLILELVWKSELLVYFYGVFCISFSICNSLILCFIEAIEDTMCKTLN